MVTEPIQKFVQLIEDAGGYAHPDLRLLVGDEAEHGMVSLAGVSNDVLSVRVPYSLIETDKERGVWLGFLDDLGYNTHERIFWTCHSCSGGGVPIIGAANHNENGGKLVETKDGVELYGCDFLYTNATDYLKKCWKEYSGLRISPR